MVFSDLGSRKRAGARREPIRPLSSYTGKTFCSAMSESLPGLGYGSTSGASATGNAIFGLPNALEPCSDLYTQGDGTSARAYDSERLETTLPGSHCRLQTGRGGGGVCGPRDFPGRSRERSIAGRLRLAVRITGR